MLEDHKTFKPPKDENTKIWRYMDFTKFVSLLSTQSLFFSRADHLGDPFEGSYPAKNVAERKILFQKIPRLTDAMLTSIGRSMRKCVAVNCWHMNETESAAMWKLYLKSDEGIAIQSTIRRLKSALDPGWPDPIWIGAVNYIDYGNGVIPGGDSLSPFIHKRSSFKHECELRAVIWRIPTDAQLPRLETDGTIHFGISVPINLEQLIENVVVAPTTPDWYFKLVQDVLKRYMCSAVAIQSDMDSDPMY